MIYHYAAAARNKPAIFAHGLINSGRRAPKPAPHYLLAVLSFKNFIIMPGASGLKKDNFAIAGQVN
jgi:hypothetical protein